MWLPRGNLHVIRRLRTSWYFRDIGGEPLLSRLFLAKPGAWTITLLVNGKGMATRTFTLK
jgi:hypothetical protein